MTSEIGITILDTRTVAEIPFSKWRKQLNTFHFRIEENKMEKPANAWLRNHKFHPDQFHHGTTQVVKHERCAHIFDTC